MNAPGVSLKAHGLRIASLDCPAGGLHEVPLAAVVTAAAREPKGGSAACIKCQNVVTLEAV